MTENINDLRRLIQPFGNVGKLTVVDKGFLPYVGKEITFDITNIRVAPDARLLPEA